MKILYTVISFLLFFNSYANAVTYDEILKKLNAKEEKINTLSFDFLQEITVVLTKEKTYNKGKIIFKKSNKFFIKNTKPFEQLIITNGETLWIYNPEENQVIVKNIDYMLEQDNFMHFFSFIFDFSRWKEEYDFLYLIVEKDSYQIAVKSKLIDEMEVFIVIDKSKLFPISIDIKSKDISINTKLKNIVINNKTNDEIFEFKIPKKAEIWHMQED